MMIMQLSESFNIVRCVICKEYTEETPVQIIFENYCTHEFTILYESLFQAAKIILSTNRNNFKRVKKIRLHLETYWIYICHCFSMDRVSEILQQKC